MSVPDPLAVLARLKEIEARATAAGDVAPGTIRTDDQVRIRYDMADLLAAVRELLAERDRLLARLAAAEKVVEAARAMSTHEDFVSDNDDRGPVERCCFCEHDEPKHFDCPLLHAREALAAYDEARKGA